MELYKKLKFYINRKVFYVFGRFFNLLLFPRKKKQRFNLSRIQDYSLIKLNPLSIITTIAEW